VEILFIVTVPHRIQNASFEASLLYKTHSPCSGKDFMMCPVHLHSLELDS